MPTPPTYLWHDYETFGANPRLDRPAQFAAIRTTMDLEPIGEPLEWFCEPCDDVLPHPEACLITGISPQWAAERGLIEPDFIANVLEALGAPGTCGVGYNSMRFDDEVTRHTAWRNFFDPYAREYRNGCSRWDLIDTVRMTYALRPEGIEWPRREDGHPSFRLEDMVRANGLEPERAHDAVSDVRSTIELARLVRQRQPKLWDWVTANRSKQAVRKLLAQAGDGPLLHVSSRFGAEHGCLSMVLPLAEHPVNKNAVLAVDLREPPDDLLELPPEDIHERLFTPAADLPEGVQRVGVKGIHVNKAPVLAPLATLSDARAEQLQLDRTACLEHARQINARRAEVAAKLVAVFAEGGEFDAGDPEQDLYGGFVSDADRRTCEQITRLRGFELAEFSPRFSDRRLDELWFRYRGRHCLEALEAVEREEFVRWRDKRIEFAPDGGLSLDAFEATVQAFAEQHSDPEALRVLADLTQWGASLRASLG